MTRRLSVSSQPSALEEIRRGIVNVAVPHNEPPGVVRRRRIVVAIVLVLGAAALGMALRRHPGEPAFYWWSLTLAGVWALGAFVSGPLHLGGARWRGRNQRPVVSGTVIGLLLGGVFIVGGLIVREIPVVAELITRVLRVHRPGVMAADHGRRAAGRHRRGAVLPRRALHRAGLGIIRC